MLSSPLKGPMLIMKTDQDKVIQSLQQTLASYQGGKFNHIAEKLNSKKWETWIRSA